jgi:uncharacterized membrane protein
MTGSGHLWAVGFEGTDRAAQVRDEITRLASEKHDLNLLDEAVAVRFADGFLTLNGEPLPVVIKSHGGTVARFLASLALTGAAVGTLVASLGDTADTACISNQFCGPTEHRRGFSARSS